jgi:hypothetical protein
VVRRWKSVTTMWDIIDHEGYVYLTKRSGERWIWNNQRDPHIEPISSAKQRDSIQVLISPTVSLYILSGLETCWFPSCKVPVQVLTAVKKRKDGSFLHIGINRSSDLNVIFATAASPLFLYCRGGWHAHLMQGNLSNLHAFIRWWSDRNSLFQLSISNPIITEMLMLLHLASTSQILLDRAKTREQEHAKLANISRIKWYHSSIFFIERIRSMCILFYVNWPASGSRAKMKKIL